MNHQPPFLQPGDTIGICAPARKVTIDEISEGIRTLENWGYHVKASKNLFGEYHQFSGTDEQRASDMQELLDDPTVKAIMSVRGGYGCMRIIDSLDFTAFVKNPKWIIGFSDLTVFQNHLHTNFNIPSIHGPMLFNFCGSRYNEASIMYLKDVLTGTPIRYSINHEDNFKSLTRTGIAQGILVGGNLSLLYALSNSKSDIDTNGKILFIEDLDEYLYHIDRMMLQLKRSGKLTGLRGLIVGGMNDMRDNTIPFGSSAEEIISSVISEFDFPVSFGFPAGHIPTNYALIMGTEVTLEVNEHETKLTFMHGKTY
jgi:muramoyltetrapeptide carboxypeptidase